MLKPVPILFFEGGNGDFYNELRRCDIENQIALAQKEIVLK